ncbi:MAG: sugar phosphate isomerase/epimerase family protein [Bacteroidota bacterium]
MNRRTFLAQLTALGAFALAPARSSSTLFDISLAEWSLHRSIFGPSLDGDWSAFGETLQSNPQALYQGPVSHLDFIVKARRDFGLDAVEYVNTFFFDRARDTAYLNEMRSRCDGEGVRSLLIMCDREGRLGDPDRDERRQAVENHHPWVDAAAYLGCHSIRVNAASAGSFEEQQALAAEGLRALTEYAAERDINILVENHGGLSSHGAWLAGVMQRVDHPRCGTLPDFGNFRVDAQTVYDRYTGVEELMPFARAVSAKANDFDEQGQETQTDYLRMMRLVLDAGYRGYVGIEYEGRTLSEDAGILATKRLLEHTREALASAYADE